MLAESLTALITGGTDGLGRAMSLRLAREGYRVFAAGRSAERRARLAEEALKLGLPITPLEMDVCDERSVDSALAELRSAAGPVDVLINNAGIAYTATMEEIRLEHLRRQFDTNFFAAVRLIQRVLPEMRARRCGWVVNMSSVGGRLALPLFGPYSSSKFALEAMSDALRYELIPFGVQVILIEPGIIRTNMEKTATELSADYLELSESGPYAGVYRGFRKGWGAMTGQSRTTPEDCAEIVLRALRAPNPNARYTVPAKEKRSVWFVRMLPDRMTDRHIARTFGLDKVSDPSAPRAIQR
jgi:NAD(P)-dependent dehydrogenase (short-subunit alcohol dehydrogenase family)